MDTKQLIIGYSGGLSGFSPKLEGEGFLKKYLRLLWDYRVRNINSNTRSGYYFFQGLKCFIQKYPDMADQVRIELWGMIDPINSQQVIELGLDDIVNITGYYPKQVSYEKLMNCHILFLPVESSKDGQRPLFIPGKLYEYLKTGKPILALAEESDCTEILSKSGLGVICSPYSPEAIADQIMQLIKNKDKLGTLYRGDSNFIESNYRFNMITKKIANIFNEILALE